MITGTSPQWWILLVYIMLTLWAFKYFRVFNSMKAPVLFLLACILYGLLRGVNDIGFNLFIAWMYLCLFGIIRSFIDVIDRDRPHL